MDILVRRTQRRRVFCGRRGPRRTLRHPRSSELVQQIRVQRTSVSRLHLSFSTSVLATGDGGAALVAPKYRMRQARWWCTQPPKHIDICQWTIWGRGRAPHPPQFHVHVPCDGARTQFLGPVFLGRTSLSAASEGRFPFPPLLYPGYTYSMCFTPLFPPGRLLEYQ